MAYQSLFCSHWLGFICTMVDEFVKNIDRQKLTLTFINFSNVDFQVQVFFHSFRKPIFTTVHWWDKVNFTKLSCFIWRIFLASSAPWFDGVFCCENDAVFRRFFSCRMYFIEKILRITNFYIEFNFNLNISFVINYLLFTFCGCELSSWD